MSKSALFVGTETVLGQHLAAAFEAKGGKLYMVDTTSGAFQTEDDVIQAVQAAEAELGQIDILIWGAFYPASQPFEEVTLADYQNYMQKAVHNAFHYTKACLKGMERRRFGRLLYLTSVIATLGDQDTLASLASGAINTFAKSVAREEARKGITANALALGLIDEWDALNKPLVQTFYQHYFPFRHNFGLGELAYQVVKMTSDEADLTNGQIIKYDGGTL